MAEPKRGRTAGFKMTDEHRGKIANSNILRALIEHVEGRREMSASQVTAGLGLLKKIMPDLAAVDHSGTVAVETHEQRIARLAGGEVAGRLSALREGEPENPDQGRVH